MYKHATIVQILHHLLTVHLTKYAYLLGG